MSLVGHDRNADARHMALLAQGNASALRQVIDIHMKSAYALAYRMLLNADDAEDVVQAAFIKLWREAHRYNPVKASLKTWLHTIVMRNSLDRLRRRKVVMEPIEDWVDTLESLDNSHLALEAKQQQLRIRFAVAALNPKQRAAISLSYFDDFTQKEAAIIMGIHIKAFEGLIGRAKAVLREALGGFDE